MEMSKAIKATKRNTNLELLRIICILAIIGDHFIGQSGIAANHSFLESLFYCTGTSLSRVACSVFVIISAWFNVDKPFRSKKIVHVWLTVIMYTVPIMFYCYRVGIIEENTLTAAFFPVNLSPLWFAGYYIILCIVSPLLNSLLNKCSQRKLGFILFAVFILLVLYPTITSSLGVLSSDMWVMIYLYLLTGYIKKYKKQPSLKMSLCLFLVCWLLLCVLRAYAVHAPNRLIAAFLSQYGELYRARMQTLPNMITAYSLFFLFLSMKVPESEIVNKLAKAVLGVYCFHQVPGWYNYLWEHFFRASYYADVLSGIQRALYTLCSILVVWLVGTLIETIRIYLSSHLIENRNWLNQLCTSLDNMVNQEENSEEERHHENKKRRIMIGVLASYFAVITALNLGGGGYKLLRIGMVTTDQSLVNELDLNLTYELLYDNGSVFGTIKVLNHGKTYIGFSSGSHPVNLGISIVDGEKNVIQLDYLHLPITKSMFASGQSVDVSINLEHMEEIVNNNYGLRFEIVQEGISWFDKSAVYYWPQLISEVNEYQWGTELYFNKRNPSANQYCISGFSGNEEEFTWTDGNSALMNFLLPSTEKDIKVILNCGIIGEVQNVDVYANENMVARLCIQEEGTQEIIIPNQFLQGETLNLKFVLPNAVSPSSMNEQSTDNRQLALRMISMKIVEN